MSKKEEGTPCVSISKFSIVKAIVTFFKLGEEGKIEAFFERERKHLTRDIKSLETASSVLTQQHENNLEDLKDKLEDAVQAVEDAYMNVDADKVASKLGAQQFSNHYWDAITIAEANVKTLEEDVELVIEAYTEKIKNNDKQIKERARRLAKISAEA